MTEGALFAGIMGFGEGFRRAGFQNLWAVEKEPFCRAVIRSRFPETELFEDVRECGKSNLRAVDVLTAGFPCQDLSVAGKRAGLAGARSGLFWEVVRILGELRPPWFVLENVPGLFSSNNGEDFRVILESLDELGYGLAWRVLDSQFFGVAQRRRRVFIVGCFGKPCPREVLFESEGGEGDFAESGEERAELAYEVAASLRGAGGGPRGFNLDAETGLTCYSVAENQRGEIRTSNVVPSLSMAGGKPGSGYPAVAHSLSRSAGHHGHSSPRGDGSDNLVSVRLAQTSSNGWGISEDGRTHTLDGTGGDAVLASLSGLGSGGPDDNDGQAGRIISTEIDSLGVRVASGISEGLDGTLPQGMDSARYRALGNAVTASVAEWIGKRIIEADR